MTKSCGGVGWGSCPSRYLINYDNNMQQLYKRQITKWYTNDIKLR